LYEVERLKNNTQVIAAQICHCVGIERVEGRTAEFYFATLRLLETGKQYQQGSFTRSGRPDYGQCFAISNVEIDAVQHL
jgi:hypothetical protein